MAGNTVLEVEKPPPGRSDLTIVEGTVTSWLKGSGLGFFESESRRVGFKRKSLVGTSDLQVGDRVVGQVNSDGFAESVEVVRK